MEAGLPARTRPGLTIATKNTAIQPTLSAHDSRPVVETESRRPPPKALAPPNPAQHAPSSEPRSRPAVPVAMPRPGPNSVWDHEAGLRRWKILLEHVEYCYFDDPVGYMERYHPDKMPPTPKRFPGEDDDDWYLRSEMWTIDTSRWLDEVDWEFTGATRVPPVRLAEVRKSKRPRYTLSDSPGLNLIRLSTYWRTLMKLYPPPKIRRPSFPSPPHEFGHWARTEEGDIIRLQEPEDVQKGTSPDRPIRRPSLPSPPHEFGHWARTEEGDIIRLQEPEDVQKGTSPDRPIRRPSLPSPPHEFGHWTISKSGDVIRIEDFEEVKSGPSPSDSIDLPSLPSAPPQPGHWAVTKAGDRIRLQEPNLLRSDTSPSEPISRPSLLLAPHAPGHRTVTNAGEAIRVQEPKEVRSGTSLHMPRNPSPEMNNEDPGLLRTEQRE